jgi:branched-chain amino acid transport system ATP-binding protein
MPEALLEVSGLRVVYDRAILLNGVSLSVGEGELVGVVGPNGAGKSTMLRAISGLVQWERVTLRGTRGEITVQGEVRLLGERIDGVPAHEIARRGLVLCPERRRPFRELRVRENLEAGAYLRPRGAERQADLDRVLELFPRLRERGDQVAGTLSGGEQQMLAIGRALMSRPRLLLIDEPSLGLSPKVRGEVFAAIAAIHRSGVPILLVEQEVAKVFQLATRNYVLSQGRVIAQGTGSALAADEGLRAAYLGL